MSPINHSRSRSSSSASSRSRFPSPVTPPPPRVFVTDNLCMNTLINRLGDKITDAQAVLEDRDYAGSTRDHQRRLSDIYNHFKGLRKEFYNHVSNNFHAAIRTNTMPTSPVYDSNDESSVHDMTSPNYLPLSNCSTVELATHTDLDNESSSNLSCYSPSIILENNVHGLAKCSLC